MACILDCSCISWFERISMTIILLNCVTLGMYEPCADSAACVTVTSSMTSRLSRGYCDSAACVTVRCRILEAFDHAIFVFFTTEMCIKVLAMGLVGRATYLAETWNCLDMFIVITGYVSRVNTLLLPAGPVINTYLIQNGTKSTDKRKKMKAYKFDCRCGVHRNSSSL